MHLRARRETHPEPLMLRLTPPTCTWKCCMSETEACTGHKCNYPQVSCPQIFNNWPHLVFLCQRCSVNAIALCLSTYGYTFCPSSQYPYMRSGVRLCLSAYRPIDSDPGHCYPPSQLPFRDIPPPTFCGDLQHRGFMKHKTNSFLFTFEGDDVLRSSTKFC
jgi:hypothetical protein